MKINMHIHSTNSDGRTNVGEILEQVKRDKLDLFSITDHDNLDSNFEINGISNYINGIELTAFFDKKYFEYERYFTAHILAYDYDVITMKNHLRQWEERREKIIYEFTKDFNKENNVKLTVTRNRRMVQKELIEKGVCKDKIS